MNKTQEEPVARSGWVVSLDFTLRFQDGELAAGSEEDGWLSFIQGRGHVFPVVEEAVEGRPVGYETELTLRPEDAYGEYSEDAVELLPLDAFPLDMDIEEGQEVELLDEETGAEMDGIIREVRDDGVLVDLNHPLAGETLQLWVRIAEVRPATDEELAHDHVHEGVHGEDDDDGAAQQHG